MDAGCSDAVLEVFIKLYEKGLIYKGSRIVNWCPVCQTSISDAEVEHEEQDGFFWHINYPVVGEEGRFVEIATTRPETLFGDTAVAVNPEDDRYKDLIGKMLVANVILNRVEDEHFPDSINEVIFQANNVVTQFSPISDGRFYSVKVSNETVEAVNKVLQGEDNSQGALYFAARKSADKENMRWFDEELNWLFAYGGHEFFF